MDGRSVARAAAGPPTCPVTSTFDLRRPSEPCYPGFAEGDRSDSEGVSCSTRETGLYIHTTALLS